MSQLLSLIRRGFVFSNLGRLCDVPSAHTCTCCVGTCARRGQGATPGGQPGAVQVGFAVRNNVPRNTLPVFWWGIHTLFSAALLRDSRVSFILGLFVQAWALQAES